jgi:hydrogenase maturation protein HypF
MCRLCQAEYENPSNRRFHAQATCCPVCGPRVFFENHEGEKISGQLAIEQAVAMLKKGMIVAVKGIGGFHLAADASNSDAVSRLRLLKERGDKPFAVMAESLDKVCEFAEVNRGEAEHLTSLSRPVVILNKHCGEKGEYEIADAVAPSNPMIGVMLPYAPLHVLLFRENLSVLVMTSANRKNDPIVCTNKDAIESLKEMSDAILFHDRDIHVRSDDSVGRWFDGRFRIFRRSRGYAPMPVMLKETVPDILATGGIMKNTLCVVKGRSAFMSPHIGDLETPAGYGFFHETSAHMGKLFDVKPSVIVHDLHPDYITSGYGKYFPEAEVMAVQHHHAHIVSCMVENEYDGDVIGFAFDGTGYGDDGTVWGGEVFIASMEGCRRVAHVGTVPMPGSAAAVKEPWRMGISWLYHTFGEEMWNLDVPLFKDAGPEFDHSAVATVVQMMERGLNSPMTSSMGRLFDAVSAIMGICTVNTYDGQAAMALEMCTMENGDEVEGYEIETAIPGERKRRYGYFRRQSRRPGFRPTPVSGESPTYKESQRSPGIAEIETFSSKGEAMSIDMRSLIRSVVRDLESHVDKRTISAKFHKALIHLFAEIGALLASRTGIRVAALSGGVFQNARLLSGLRKALSEKNITVLTHALVPTNDGGLSLGQAGIAAAICRKRKCHDL